MSGFRERRAREVMRELGCSFIEACREMQRRSVRKRLAMRARLTAARESWVTRWERAHDR